MNTIYAEDLPYWKTSKSGVETWLDRTEKLLTEIKAIVHTRIVGKSMGREGILIGYTINDEEFRISWPVLSTKKEGDSSAALRQAATMIYHDTKARVNRIKIFPPRVVFSDWLLIEGKTLAESNEEEGLNTLRLLTS